MYLRIKDVFAMAADYMPSGKETTEFFSSIQNKLHYAITGHSAAELMMMRADAAKPNMGLTSWVGDRIHASDITVAKNYLNEEEISDFNRLTSLVWTLSRIRQRTAVRYFCMSGKTSLTNCFVSWEGVY